MPLKLAAKMGEALESAILPKHSLVPLRQEALLNSNGKSAQINGGFERKSARNNGREIRFADLFCGIGGFHIAASQFGWKCAFASDIDRNCQKAYLANFDMLPAGDLQKIATQEIPDHDVLFAGFPCQPFSIIGDKKGFEDTRGTLFFNAARILEQKRPKAFVLENVKMLAGHNEGRTLARIIEVLKNLNYSVDWKVLNALDFGLPQKRERIFIVGFDEPVEFRWPNGGKPTIPLADILEKNVPKSFYASPRIIAARLKKHRPTAHPAIWHENLAGHVSSYPYSCALRANASYNYLLVDGIRRLTPREMLRLQGFPDNYEIVCGISETRKQAGNSVPIPIVSAIIKNMLPALMNFNATKNKKSKQISTALAA